MSRRKTTIFVSKLFAPEKRILEILEPHFKIKLGKPPFDEEILIRELRDVDGAIVTMDCPMTRRVMESLPKLKMLSKYGAGVENIDLNAATDLGIIVACSPLNYQSVAECAIFMMIGCLRKITRVLDFIKKGKWKDIAPPAELSGHELARKTVGVIGLGRIGSQVSKILKAFEAEVLAYDPFVSLDKAAQVGAKLVDLVTLLKRSDIVTIHCQLTSETRHLIDEKKLKLMKPTAIIVNTSRGGVIDEKALRTALEKGWIAAAGLDVTDPEPPDPNNALLRMDNVLMTPHIAAATVEARERMHVQTPKNVVDVLVEGKLPPKECIANSKVLEVKMRAKLKCARTK